MSETHQVLPTPSMLALGQDGALRFRVRVPSSLKSIGRKLAVGVALIGADLVAAWLAAGLAGFAVEFALPALGQKPTHLPVELLVLVFLTLGLTSARGKVPLHAFGFGASGSFFSSRSTALRWAGTGGC